MFSDFLSLTHSLDMTMVGAMLNLFAYYRHTNMERVGNFGNEDESMCNV